MHTIFQPGITRSMQRRLLGMLSVGGAMLCFLIALATFQSPATAGAVAPNRASVVAQFDAETRLVRTIEFTEPISGLKALELSGLEIVTRSYSFGDAVCSIAGVGCPADDCFCSSNYWSYWYWDGADWQGYMVGAGSSVISQTGAVEGWRWGQFGDLMSPVTPSLQAVSALDWLAPRQTITGDFGGVAATVETVLALGANLERNDLANEYLNVTGAAYSRSSAGAAGKLAVALTAASAASLSHVAGIVAVAQTDADACLPAGALTPSAFFSSTLGAYSTQSGINAWAILGTIALSETAPVAAVDYLAAQMQPAGGWEWAPGWGVDTNATGLAIQALVAAGKSVTSTEVISGLAYLESVQRADGGFPYAGGAGAVSDVNSTAYVMQALVAAGEDLRSPRWTRPGGNPFDFLAALQLTDGSFEWQVGSGANQLATQQAIPALLGRAYPVQRLPLAVCPAVYLPLVSRD